MFGAAFIDRFLPMPLQEELRADVWGSEHTGPRDVMNGIEDAEFSYWGGNIILGDDDQFHLFVCRWPEDNVKGKKSGHHTWWSSRLVHAVGDSPMGPFAVVEDIGPAHNPEIYRLKDGSYIVGAVWDCAYKAQTLDGPWERIPFSFEYLSGVEKLNRTNRTYVVRDDGSVLMMNKSAFVFISDNADEHFRQVSEKSVYPQIPKAHLEDPVIWKDEIQYHMVMNDAHGRVAFYMRSPDGLRWKWAPGRAYDLSVTKHEGGTRENWFKLERPKVVQDQYGRATHMNFAAIDWLKSKDLANDDHSSKNLVVPLVVPRRLRILNSDPLVASTERIELKILAEPGFDPATEVDVGSLSFGAPEEVDFGRGCQVIEVEESGRDLLVVFSGQGHGVSEDNFVAKLIGRTTKGGLLLGYADLP